MAWSDAPPTAAELAKAPAAKSWDSAPPTKEELSKANEAMQIQKINQMNESGDASNDALLNTVALGYLPQIKAKAKQILSGEGAANDENYVKRRDQEIADMKARAEKYPGAHAEGTVVGFVAPMLATGGASAAETAAEAVPALTGDAAAAAAKQGILKTAAKGAGTGAAIGGAANPGDTAGVLDPLQLKERAKNAAIGAGTGSVLSAAVSKIPDAAEALDSFSKNKAFKATGAMLKDYRKAGDKVGDLGGFALDNGLVKAGDKLEDIAAKADDLRQKTGDELGKGYSAAAEILPKLGPEATEKVNAAGFNPVRDKDAIIAAAKDDLGYSFNSKKALASLSDYLDDLADKHGDVTLDPKTTNQIKTALDKTAINWERNPLTREPDTEAALKTFRGFLSDKVSGQVQALGDVIGNPEAAKNLADLNSRYGMASKISRIAGDRVNRESANQMFSLTDKVAAAGTAAAKGGPVGLIAAAGTAVGSKVARTYGPSTLAAGSKAAAELLASTPRLAAIQKSNPALYESLLSSVGAKLPGKTAIVNNEPGKDSGASSNAQNPPPNPAPAKGPDKWANDGLKKLMDHSAADPATTSALEQMKQELIDDPKTKQILINASDLSPGSKAMENALSKIKARLDEKDGE